MLQHLEARFLFVYCCLIRAILLMLAFTLTRTTTCTRNTCVVDLELSKSRVENDAHFSFSVFAIFAAQQKRRKQQAIFVQKEEYTADGNINVSQLRLSFFFQDTDVCGLVCCLDVTIAVAQNNTWSNKHDECRILRIDTSIDIWQCKNQIFS